MKNLISTIRVLLFFIVITGILYPLMITIIAQLFFSWKSEGSILYQNGSPVASLLLAQKINTYKFFHYRPSAANYATNPSGASNLGPASSVLKDRIITDSAYLKKIYNTGNIPFEMLLTSGSGLDPHTTLDAALLQLPLVSMERNLSVEQTKMIGEFIIKSAKKPFLQNRTIINVNDLNFFMMKNFPL